MSMERLKRSFTMGTIKEKQDGTQSISMEVPTTVITSDTSSPKVISPLFNNGKCFPDTIFEENAELHISGNRKNKYDMERQQILDQELHRDHKHISDFSDRRSNNNKSVFRLSTLKGDEGLGESLDLNSEQSSGSPKISEKFGNDLNVDTMSRLQVPNEDDIDDHVEEPSCSFDFDYFSDMFSDDPADGKPSKRVTFL